MHKQKCLKDFKCDMSDKYPVTDMLTEKGFYLPSSSNLKKTEIRYICNLIKRFKDI